MARNRIELEEMKDFTGGLNLMVDPVELEPNETFELQNVDIGRRGGFNLRHGMKRFIDNTTGLSGTMRTSYTFVNASGTQRVLLINTAFRIVYWDGDSWEQIKAVGAGTHDSKCVEMRNTVYFICSEALPHKWDGVAVSTTALAAPGFNDDLTAPNEGNMPRATTGCVWQEVFWVGNTRSDPDGAVDRPSRIRWSHPGKPEDWRTNDWMDLDPDDETGEIRAMVPFGDRMLVFKDQAVYAIAGAPPASFEQRVLTKQIGAPNNGSVFATEQGVYFWDMQTGAWLYDGSKFVWIFEKIYRLITDSFISTDRTKITSVAFHNQRLYCGVRWIGPPYNEDGDVDVVLVYDPYAGKDGAWMIHVIIHPIVGPPAQKIYRFAPTAWHVHEDSTGVRHLIGTSRVLALVMEWDTPNYFQDDTFSAGGSSHGIPAFYTTRWFNAGNNAMKKRWKRPVIVMRAPGKQTTLIEVLNDYDTTDIAKTFEIEAVVPTTTVQGAYLNLDGSDAHAVTTEFAGNPTNTVVMGVDVDPVDASSGAAQTLMSKFQNSSGDLRSIMFQFSATGFPRVIVSNDGTLANQVIITCDTAVPDDNRRTYWVEYNPDDGGGNRVTKFYTSTTLTGTKTQLGSTITTVGTKQVFDSAEPWRIGAFDSTLLEELNGKVYAAELRQNGLTGTVLFQPVFAVQSPGITDFVDLYSVAWNIFPDAAITAETVVISVDGVWDVDLWDFMVWARETILGEERSVILRGAPLGSGVARALRFRQGMFEQVAQGQDWRIHGVTMKWIPRRIRN